MEMTTSKFEDKEFQAKFTEAMDSYNRAVETGENPPSVAKEFMDSIFEGDSDAALEYEVVLEKMQDPITARILQDIVFNSVHA